ncbi:MAG: hypothetical protein HC795_18935 [Coleofasciculaceae cyanobacterium RL_1_1]|nr:hypothetical protein [Coleofasciculaceae cyanobacterium RL_1_1]
MSRQKIAQLTAQLKSLPPTSPAAKALRAALIQAKAQLSAAAVSAPPPAVPVEVPATPPLVPVEAVEVSAPASPPSLSEAPLTESIPESVVAPSRIYQAIGTIYAELYETEPGSYQIEWRGKRWSTRLRKVLLKRVAKLLGQPRHWRVYPHTRMSDQGFIVDHFVLVSQPQEIKDDIDGEFRLSGCWESLPQWQGSSKRSAYFSVYANAQAIQRHPILCRSYPLNWPGQPPFEPKFGEQSPWHSIIASLQTDGVFEFARLLDGPAPAPPRLSLPAVVAAAPATPAKPPAQRRRRQPPAKPKLRAKPTEPT